MAPLNRLQTLKEIYDSRAQTYDNEVGFHREQHADYLKWMSLKLGDNVLDLACGTGGVTIPAKKTTGPSGTVIGVDISPVSLAVARSKAEKENLDVTFLEYDIGNLQGLEAEGIKEGYFDVIVCASAIKLLEDPISAVKSWVKLLKKGGKIIFDVPTADSMIRGLLLDLTAHELGVPVVYGRALLESEESISRLLVDAGLDSSESFNTKNYRGPEHLDSSKSEYLFEEMASEGKWFIGWYKILNEPGTRDAAKQCFSRELLKLADGSGKVASYLRFHMAVGRKL